MTRSTNVPNDTPINASGFAALLNPPSAALLPPQPAASLIPSPAMPIAAAPADSNTRQQPRRPRPVQRVTSRWTFGAARRA